MTDQELLPAIDQMMDRKLDQKLTPICQRLDRVEEELSEAKETLSEVRTGGNTLLEWAEETGESIAFPLPKINL